jgi:hypothetical protein
VVNCSVTMIQFSAKPTRAGGAPDQIDCDRPVIGASATRWGIETGSPVPWRHKYQNAFAALRMIRETIETLGPPGALPSRDTVLIEHGLDP